MKEIISTIKWQIGSSMYDYHTNVNYSDSPSYVTNIEQEIKQISDDKSIIVYCGYRNKQKVFEVEAGVGITLHFKS